VIGTMLATAGHQTCSIDKRHNAEKPAKRGWGKADHRAGDMKSPAKPRGSRRAAFAELYFPLGVVSGLTLPPLEVLPPMLAFAPVDDFMLAPVVVDELVEVDVGCLCLCIFADAAKGEPTRPAITSAAIVSLLFIMTWNSSLDQITREATAAGGRGSKDTANV
jgi:hypothetical protein